MEPAALLSRLDRALSAGWARDLPERQRKMRATLDWSHELLEGPERTLFRRLSVFAGGFALEAAEEVGATEELGADEIAEPLGRLVEQSLATVGGDASGGTRYGMLEPVRQYAAERLGEGGDAAPTRGRHAEHFLALAETARPELMGAGHAAWLGRLEQEHDNLREALRWARESGEAKIGLRLVGSLYWFWWMHGHLGEGRRWVEVFPLECDGREASGRARALALYGAGELALGQGDLARSVALLEESLALFRRLEDGFGVAIVLAELGQAVRAWGDCDRAAALSEEALALGRRLGRRDATAVAL